jgi:hypothetical protein
VISRLTILKIINSIIITKSIPVFAICNLMVWSEIDKEQQRKNIIENKC